MHRKHFELAIYWDGNSRFEEGEIAGLSGTRGKRVLFMAEDVSFVVARRFRNAAEPITEISLNVDGSARTQKEEAIPAFTRPAAPFVKYPLEAAIRFATDRT